MPNVINNIRQSASQARVYQYLTIVSDGTQETDYVVYDSSAVATALGITDPQTCNILSVKSIVCTASSARLKLDFKATSNVLAVSIPADTDMEMKFCEMGGLRNYAGAGKNGDITLTTTGLATGDTVTIILEVKPS